MPELNRSSTERRVTIGDNQPSANTIAEVTDRLARDYNEMTVTAAALLDRAEQLPEEIETEAELERFSNLVVEMRGTIARVEATRQAEKEPYLRSGQAVDGYFSTLKERIAKGMNVMTRRVSDYQNRKLRAERERLRREDEERRRIARVAAEQAERERREAEEARLAAERARKPETKQAKQEIAAEQEAVAAHATVTANIAADEAEAARIDTLRKPSEIARSRFDEGRLVTTREVGYVEITDKSALDKEALWPFLKEEEILKALRAWARTTSHKKPMDGAIVEMRDEAVIR
jgi:hypothetical protein